MRIICHPELRNEIGSWGFKGEEDNSQGNKSRCLVIRCLSCHTDRAFRKKVISVNSSLFAVGPLSKFFGLVKGVAKAFLKSTKVAHCEEAHSKLLHCAPISGHSISPSCPHSIVYVTTSLSVSMYLPILDTSWLMFLFLFFVFIHYGSTFRCSLEIEDLGFLLMVNIQPLPPQI